MKNSIKTQIVILFAGLTVGSLVALMAMNSYLLQPFYVRQKVKAFENMYDTLLEEMSDYGQSLEEIGLGIQDEAENENISFLISNQRFGKVVSNVHNMDYLNQQMINYILNDAQRHGEILKETENYLIVKTKDPLNENEYIEMWGYVGIRNTFLMRSPFESIEESVAISSRFQLMIGIVVVIIGIAVARYCSRRLTAPILELAILSNKMADLDFEAKYTSGGQSEIGLLGANFNRMSEELERTISELKTANNSLRKDIERKEKMEEMRNEFLGNVSHELKTPITLIQGYAEGLKEGIIEDEESREFYCDVILDEAQKMNQMVKNLLTLNQLEFGAEEIEFVRINLTELIKGVIQSMEIFLQQKNVEILFEQEENIYAWTDEYKLEQVISNYLSNAIHHVNEKGVIRVTIECNEGKAKVFVFNTGKQIPEADLKHIWDKFYKVDKAHTRKYGGNGIGLSIVKAVMESMYQGYGVQNCDNGVEFWFEVDIK